jgi:hypothetical protein
MGLRSLGSVCVLDEMHALAQPQPCVRGCAHEGVRASRQAAPCQDWTPLTGLPHLNRDWATCSRATSWRRLPPLVLAPRPTPFRGSPLPSKARKACTRRIRVNAASPSNFPRARAVAQLRAAGGDAKRRTHAVWYTMRYGTPCGMGAAPLGAGLDRVVRILWVGLDRDHTVAVPAPAERGHGRLHASQTTIPGCSECCERTTAHAQQSRGRAQVWLSRAKERS